MRKFSKSSSNSHKKRANSQGFGHAPRDVRGPKDNYGDVWLYGWHPVLNALQNSRRIKKKLLILKKTEPSILEKLASEGVNVDAGFPVEVADNDAFQRIFPKDAVHQGIALLTNQIEPEFLDEFINHLPATQPCVLLALDQVTDPHNVGAILRTVAAFGAAGLLVTEHHAPPQTGVLAKSASGALEHVPFIQLKNLSQGLGRLKEAGFWTIGLDERGEKNLQELGIPERVVFVLGSEGDGLRRLTRDACDYLVRIPTQPNFPSLNVSNAAAICLFDAIRKGETHDRN